MIHWIPAEHSPLNTCLAVFLSAVLSGLRKTSRSYWWWWWWWWWWLLVGYFPVRNSQTVLHGSPVHTSQHQHASYKQSPLVLCWSSLHQTLQQTLQQTFIARVKKSTSYNKYHAWKGMLGPTLSTLLGCFRSVSKQIISHSRDGTETQLFNCYRPGSGCHAV